MSNVTATQVPGEEPAKPEVIDGTPAAQAPKKHAKTAAQANREALELPKTGSLPDMADVDPDKIARATLTKQGWVCPTPKQHPAQRL